MKALLVWITCLHGLSLAQHIYLTAENKFTRPYWAPPGQSLKPEFVDVRTQTATTCECRKQCLLRPKCLSFSMNLDGTDCMMSYKTRGSSQKLQHRTRYLHFIREAKTQRFSAKSYSQYFQRMIIPGGITEHSLITVAATNINAEAKFNIILKNTAVPDFFYKLQVYYPDRISVVAKDGQENTETVPVSNGEFNADQSYLIQIEITADEYKLYLNGENVLNTAFTSDVTNLKEVRLTQYPSEAIQDLKALIVQID